MKILPIVLSLTLLTSIPCFSAPKQAKPVRKLASVQEGSEEIKVKGQSRNFTMSLILKSKKDKIKFGEIRENYREEVKGTGY